MHSMPCAVELLAQALLAEARDADDALARRGALGQLRERRADLAADAENDDVALDRAELGHELRARRGHHLFEMLGIAKTVGQRA